MKDYSQHGEQGVILGWTRGRVGSFIDLGCYDGETSSNTAALADLGWGGLCLDVAPDALAACASRYGDRPDIGVMLAAFVADGYNSPAEVFWTPEKQYSGLHASKRDDVQLVSMLVPRVSLRWLSIYANALPRPLFASIDIEGDSLSALAWLLNEVQPDCVCVEANHTSEQRQVAAMMGGAELLAANPWNSIYARIGVPA